MSDTELERFTKMLKKMKAKRARKVDIQGVEDRIKFLNKGKRNAVSPHRENHSAQKSR